MAAPTTPPRSVRIPIADGDLHGDLVLPPAARGLILFAHGSGSSRHSHRNRRVARILNDAGLGTLLIDLLTSAEEIVDSLTAHLRFDIELLTTRVMAAIEWCGHLPELDQLPLGLFGASTGAAAALTAAARDPAAVSAVVSRGGRPDLAEDALAQVRAPTLLIVGARDTEVLGLNEQAGRRLSCEHRIAVIPGASHLFEEGDTLDRAAKLAASWFLGHLGSESPDRSTPRHVAERSRVTRSRVGRRHPPDPRYADRAEAGRRLARAVAEQVGELTDPIVIGLPRGGVEVALPVAEVLRAPLDIVVVRKIGVPSQPELALGAVDEEGNSVIDDRLTRMLRLAHAEVHDLVDAAFAEATERAARLRGDRPTATVAGRDVVLVDDGYATGMTAMAAARLLKRRRARRVILAVPVAPRSLLRPPVHVFDEIVCPWTPEPFRAVGLHYRSFDQVTDDEVRDILFEARASTPADRARGHRS